MGKKLKIRFWRSGGKVNIDGLHEQVNFACYAESYVAVNKLVEEMLPQRNTCFPTYSNSRLSVEPGREDHAQFVDNPDMIFIRRNIGHWKPLNKQEPLRKN